MKNYWKKIGISALSYLLLVVLTSIICSLIGVTSSTSTSSIASISRILSFVYALGYGLLGGILLRKKGIRNGILLVILYLLILFVMRLFEPLITVDKGIFILIKSILIISGSIIGVNIRPLK